MAKRYTINRLPTVSLLLVAVMSWVGCAGSATNGPTAAGAKVLLDTEPTDVGGIIELKSAMITGIAASGDQTAVAGRVVNGQDWEPDQAMFLVRDLQADELHAHDHGDGDHSDCAFCQAKEKETGALALIQVIDETGQVLGTDARQLLGLQENEVVVAQGSGTIDEDGTLVFAASKIYIRK